MDRKAINLGEERIELLAGRAVWLPRTRALLVADLHLGKSEALRRAGAPVPAGVSASQLERLSTLLEVTSAARLIVLGDLLHAPAGVTDELVDRFGDWARAWGGAVELVEGNHDRRVEHVADRMGLGCRGERLLLDGFELVHDPAEATGDRPALAGHVHPAIVLRGTGDTVRLPCFWLNGQRLVLPAFTPFAAGAPIAPEPGDRVVACTGDELVEVPAVRTRRATPRRRSPAR